MMLIHIARAIAFASMLASVPAGDVGTRLAARKDVAEAIRFIEASEAAVIDDQIRLCEIPAPPFKEGHRADALKKDFVTLGLANVRIDEAGNVIGERAGTKPRPNLVLSAHLDTVFPEGTDVRVRREGTTLRGPGIADDCRGLAVLLGVLRALDRARIRTEGTITFGGTVGEEGAGDLRGVKHLVNTSLRDRMDRFVSIDGGGLDITSIAVGSRRYRVAFKGPGGHSYSDFGLPSPLHALGRLVASVAELTVPEAPKTTFTVGRVGGGTSVNSIAADAWLEMDMRSADHASLAELDRKFAAAVDQAAAAENARWKRPGVITVEKQIIGDRPSGQLAATSLEVRAALSVSRALGLTAKLIDGSTDANYPMSRGIPAITIDGGGSSSGTHSLDEAFDARDSWKGTARALLLSLALTESRPD
jgi:tripeptide aminopeptidase